MSQSEAVQEGAGKAAIHARVLPVINYCMQQNGADALGAVTVENGTGEPLANVELSITSAPGFALPMSRRIDSVPAGQSLLIPDLRLTLDGEFLAAMTEKVTGLLSFRLIRGEEIIASLDTQITVLAFDEWSGLGIYPELLAGFVTPNHPEIAQILRRAADFLEKWTGDSSLDAYQSRDPNRVLSQAAAIYSAIREKNIAYAVHPASFEETGQRVRLCDAVLHQGLGTCLDLTLLFASCLEGAGLHPILITTPGHIFAGVWLEEKMFPECVRDDPSLITKRLASGVNEIAVVETTCLTSGRDQSFDEARAAAEGKLPGTQYIIDIHRARMSHILPLPQRVPTADGWTLRREEKPATDPSQPRQLGLTIRVDPIAKEESIPKKVQWERKLLDLGLRNNLINLRLTKNQLPILAGSLDGLEDALADGSDFTILPRPADVKMEEFSFETLAKLGESEVIRGEFENKRLRSVLTEGELSRCVKELYRTAKTALEENGANTLYLAIGMLRWFENKRSTKARYAPIILVPIEMVRKSAALGYVIRLRDDDPQMNVTLLEKLKQDFGIQVAGVDPLPMDDHGIDIRRVLTILRQAVMNQPHWDVLEAASIGIFSFSQFVMWNDIRNRTDDLLKNKIVRSLVDGKLGWEAGPLEIGEWVSEDDVLLPMAADASQLHAIRAACEGKSFVLHGPPGTGKSQTITSLIAGALAQGKRVLFVAEKMAALEVVQRRLDSIGIGPFCLELHSNKSRKKDVLEQLRQASEVTKTVTSQEFEEKAERLKLMRRELDGYVRQLHKPQPCGSDLYTLINEYEQEKNAPDLPPFDPDYLKMLDRGAIEGQQLLIERMTAAGREAGHPHGHPLARVGCTQYSQSLRNSLRPTVENYSRQLAAVSEYADRLTSALGQPRPASVGEVQQLAGIAEALCCWYEMPKAWAKADFPQQYFDQVIQMARHFTTAGEKRQQLMEWATEDIFSLDGAQLFAQFTEASAKWLLPKTLGLSKLCKQLNLCAKVPVDKEKLKERIGLLRDQQREEKAASELLSVYGKDLGAFYAGTATDWQKLESLAAQAQRSAQAIWELTGSYEILHSRSGGDGLRDSLMGFAESFGPMIQAKEVFDELLTVSQKREENWLSCQRSLCDAVLAHADELKEWTAYVGAAAEARAMGLDALVDCYERGAAHEKVLHAYRKALLQGLISVAIDESMDLNQFSGAVFSKKIQQYRRMDSQWTELSRQEAYCRLAAKVPDFTREAAHSSELGILQRAIKSGGRGVSIRRLFDQIPNLLPRLCPCMLMSPISAAQYLDPKAEPFDIVVFDEASQLPTCKAVGVLARGREAVIVGDPKQMPPTSFFAVNTVDEDNLDVEDLESILDDCLALNMPQTYLLWHYRSRHESLIAFSNSRFYENRLLTFPSVNDRETKVRLIPVKGVFERGRSRTNRAEAQAVVEELKRRCTDPELSRQSLGVVTFNIQQQNLIDDLLNEACAKDPDLEKWAFGAEEPVFIKNLENVQGDERDVILFSIGYGPDEEGRVYMNFGPLNREGGWRRLNVAVSRARREMVVFSTLSPDQIDLNRTQAEGVAALRDFLEYAQGRPLAAAQAEHQKAEPSGIAQAICKALEEQGYDTDRAVGRSGYRIDIGVVDPKDPDKYCLGLLLDGDRYGSAKTTRDREIAQEGVLTGLGWHILRIWAMDWWDNRDKELKRILSKLSDIMSGAADEPPVEAPPAGLRSIAPKAPAALTQAPDYIAAKLSFLDLPAEDFTDPAYEKGIRKKIRAVLAAEAPVSAAVLTKRVVQSYGISRAGSRIQGHLNSLLRKEPVKTTVQGDTVFCWREDQNPDTYPGFRVSGEGEDRRDVREIPLQEIVNTVCTVLHEQGGMASEDLLRETGKKLGYPRLVGSVPEALEAGLCCAQDKKVIAVGPSGTCILTGQGTERAIKILEFFQNSGK